MWSSQDGSLLLWAWVLSITSSAVLFATRNQHRELVPWATAVLDGPRRLLHRPDALRREPVRAPQPGAGRGRRPRPAAPPPGDGDPPADALLGLRASGRSRSRSRSGRSSRRRLDASWIRSTRRFALIAWLFLGVGILLGARWSYSELGWGGYWGWDPVENASLMPWLVGTAFLHSIMVQETRGMLRVWNVSLICAHLRARAARHVPGALRDPRVDPRLRRVDRRRAAARPDRDRHRSARRS